MEKEIRDIIKKNLPAEVGEMLQGELSELKDLRTKVKALENQITGLADGKKEADSRAVKAEERLRGIEEREDSVTAREEACHQVELTQEHQMLQVRMECAAELAGHCKEVALNLVRNTEYRTTRAFDHSWDTTHDPMTGHVTSNTETIHPEPKEEIRGAK